MIIVGKDWLQEQLHPVLCQGIADLLLNEIVIVKLRDHLFGCAYQ